MLLLTEDSVAMTLRAVVRRLRLMEGRSLPVFKSMLEFSVAQASVTLLVRSRVRLNFG